MRRLTPLRADPAKTRAWQDRSRGKLKRRTPLQARSFSEVHADDPRYGPEFDAIRDLECFCVTFAYSGPGHEKCGPGSRGLGHTAAHLSAEEDTLMVPACGAAHDLVDGYVSETTVRVFRDWVAGQEWRTLAALAERYWREVAS
jgi:hypothetical protein